MDKGFILHKMLLIHFCTTNKKWLKIWLYRHRTQF
jgi:hypothetical protein